MIFVQNIKVFGVKIGTILDMVVEERLWGNKKNN